MGHTIRPLRPADLPFWRELRRGLWPDVSDNENLRDSEDALRNPDRLTVFVSDSDGAIDGFIEVSLRPYAEGCESSPVGYVEGWYVVPESRGAGVGRRLINAAETWARQKGCTEMASNTGLDNVESQRAHMRLGYTEVERIVCFRKALA